MTKKILWALVCCSVAGCATVPHVGSAAWHGERVVEIEQAYDAWEIDEEEYLQLRTETDAIRSDYLDRLERRRASYYYGFGYGYGYGYGRYGHFGSYWGYGPYYCW